VALHLRCAKQLGPLHHTRTRQHVMRRSLQQARISTAPSMHHWVRGNAASASNTSHCHCCAQLPKLHFSSVSSSLSRLQMSTHPSDVAGCRCDDVIFRILAETNPKTSRAQNVCTSSCASIKREHDCSLLRQRALTLALLLHTSPPVRMTGTSRPTAQQTALAIRGRQWFLRGFEGWEH
jgi:hypothetical protein